MKNELDALIAKIRKSVDPSTSYSEAIGYVTRDNDAWLAEQRANDDAVMASAEVQTAIAAAKVRLGLKPKK